MNRMLNTLGATSSMSSAGQRNANPASELDLARHPTRVSIPMDIVETNTEYQLQADTPGMSPEDLKVELHVGVLTLSGSRKIARDDKSPDGKVWRSERTSYSFARSFTLPDNANSEGISATVDAGVLKVTVPKREPEPKPEPKRIAVRGA